MYRRGDIFYANLGKATGYCISGKRPVLIVSNDIANLHSSVITVVPLTTRMKKRNLPTHVELRPADSGGLHRTSMILAEQVRSIDKCCLLNYAGHVTEESVMDRVEQALLVQLGTAARNGGTKVELTRN